MKKILGTKLGIILVIALVVLVASAGFAYAATTYTKDVPTTGMILKANPGLTLYSDAACTVEITALPFPDVSAGNSVTLPTFYIKNTGNKDLTGIDATSNLLASMGTIDANFGGSGFPSTSLTRNASIDVHLTLSTLLDGVTGDTPINCTTSFGGTYN